MTIRTGIVGAAGFAGIELTRLLIEHPDFEVAAVTSDAEAGTHLSALYPSFMGSTDLTFTTHDDPTLTDCDVVFLAVPHTAAMKHAPTLLEAGVTVVDLSADYRLKDKHLYEKWYGACHESPELLETVTFGLPELFPSELTTAATRHANGEAVLVSCAGCYPTATSLAAFPAVDAGLTQGVVVVDAISGVTGAGKKANERTHFCFANENVEAYGVGSHRHTPEIEQILGIQDRLVFTPHLAPLGRGLLSTVTMTLSPAAEGCSAADIQDLYERFYAGSPFVQVLPRGAYPKTSSVVGTNRAQVAVVLQETTGTLVAIGAIDNLCKGAAGQAVQCANVVFGLSQTAGLDSMPLPV